MSSRVVRIATWNILHGLDFVTGEDNLEGIATTLRVLDADVVALQEVDRDQPRSGGLHQAEFLARQLGYTALFAPALSGNPDRAWTVATNPDDGGPAYGIALLSRVKLRAYRRLRLPGGGDGQRAPDATPTRPGWDHEPRWALQAKLTTAGCSITVTCTHLSYMPWRSIRQLGRLLAVATPDADPAVLLGDFNLPPAVLRARAVGWRSAGGSPTHPSPAPRLQLDHVLVRGAEILRGHVGPRAVSDHLPVVAEVRLPG